MDTGYSDPQGGHVENFESSLPQADLKRPTVSIVVTNYNYGRYLRSCLNSIAGQSHTGFDCVIVDDASEDDSLDVIGHFLEDKADDDRFRLVRHENNQGQMGAFKTGLANTGGTFVIFVDADDILLPDFIETHLKAHLNGSYAVAFTCSDQLQIGDDGEILASTYPKVYRRRGGYDADALDGLPPLLRWEFSTDGPIRLKQRKQGCVYLPAISGYFAYWFWSTTSAMMYRRATLEMILSEDCDRFRVCADYYLVTFAQAVGGSIVIPGVHGCYRRHDSNAFSHSSVIGGEHPPGNLLNHPPFWHFNVSFVNHLVANFERFITTLGPNHAYMLVARFSTKKLFRRLIREAPSTGGPHFKRMPLIRSNIIWKTFKTYILLIRRVKFALRFMSAKS